MAGSASVLWSLAGLVGLLTVAPKIDQAVAPAASHEASDGLAIPRAPDGQFYTDARLNGTPVRMMVDPRATKVVLSGEDAARLGITPASGFTSISLPRLAIGNLEVERVEAVIAPELPVSLIGQSYLSRLAGYRVEREQLVLR